MAVKSVFPVAGAVLLLMASSCSTDAPPTAPLQSAPRSTAAISMSVDGETYSIDPATRTLSFSDGTTSEVDDVTSGSLATAFQATNEYVAEAVQDMTAWALDEPCNDISCYDRMVVPPSEPTPIRSSIRPTPHRLMKELEALKNRPQGGHPTKVQIRLATGEDTRSSARKKVSVRQPDEQAAYRFASHTRPATRARHTSGVCLTARHGAAASRGAARQVKLSMMQYPSPCRDVALSMYNLNMDYRASQVVLREAMRLLRDAEAAYRACTTASCRQGYQDVIDQTRPLVRDAARNVEDLLRRLQAGSSRYSNLGCWNSSSGNWGSGFPRVASGGGSNEPRFERSCSTQTWEISFDGGSTWYSFQAETCVVTLVT